jgi:phytoene synthase
MDRHGIDVEFLNAKRENGSPIFPGYKELLENLMADADADYERAFESIPALPRFFQGPVAVAASVYRGIHDEIRKNDYDNLTRRASTSLPRKVLLAWKGLRTLREVGARQALETADGAVPLRTFRNQAEGRAAS